MVTNEIRLSSQHAKSCFAVENQMLFFFLKFLPYSYTKDSKGLLKGVVRQAACFNVSNENWNLFYCFSTVLFKFAIFCWLFFMSKLFNAVDIIHLPKVIVTTNCHILGYELFNLRLVQEIRSTAYQDLFFDRVPVMTLFIEQRSRSVR